MKKTKRKSVLHDFSLTATFRNTITLDSNGNQKVYVVKLICFREGIVSLRKYYKVI
jgi:hypothetical protein